MSDVNVRSVLVEMEDSSLGKRGLVLKPLVEIYGTPFSGRYIIIDLGSICNPDGAGKRYEKPDSFPNDLIIVVGPSFGKPGARDDFSYYRLCSAYKDLVAHENPDCIHNNWQGMRAVTEGGVFCVEKSIGEGRCCIRLRFLRDFSNHFAPHKNYVFPASDQIKKAFGVTDERTGHTFIPTDVYYEWSMWLP